MTRKARPRIAMATFLALISAASQAAIYQKTPNTAPLCTIDNSILLANNSAVYDEKSNPDKSNPQASVRTVISNSSDERVRNAYNNIGNWSLCIEQGWHFGGHSPMDNTYPHITVRVFKDNVRKVSCHLYAGSKDGRMDRPFYSSCE